MLHNKDEAKYIAKVEKDIKFNTLSSIADVTKAFNKHVSKLANETQDLTDNDAALVTGSMFNIINRKQAK